MLHLGDRHVHSPSARVASALGFRRVEEVRVTVDDRRTIAEVTAVAHRYPRRFRISLASAAQLVKAGVPLHVDDRRSAPLGEGTSA